MLPVILTYPTIAGPFCWSRSRRTPGCGAPYHPASAANTRAAVGRHVLHVAHRAVSDTRCAGGGAPLVHAQRNTEHQKARTPGQLVRYYGAPGAPCSRQSRPPAPPPCACAAWAACPPRPPRLCPTAPAVATSAGLLHADGAQHSSVLHLGTGAGMPDRFCKMFGLSPSSRAPGRRVRLRPSALSMAASARSRASSLSSNVPSSTSSSMSLRS